MNFFSPDNPVTRFLTRLCDLIILNLLFMICCLPIFTIGASITAMYSITLKMLRNEECYIIKGFLSAFKSNFKQATLLWIPCFLIGAFLIADLYIVNNILPPEYYYLKYPVLCLIIAFLCGYLYMFPLLSFFDAPLKQQVKNAFLLSLGHLPTTIVVLCLHLFILILVDFYNFLLIPVFSVFVFCGFSTMALLYSYYYRKVFDSHLPESDVIE